MKKSIVLLVFLYSCLFYAQTHSVKGKLLTESGETVPLMDIQVLNPNHDYLQTIATDTLGYFELVTDIPDAILSVEVPVFQKLEQHIVLTDTAFITLKLTEASETLNEMVIVKKKPVIKQKLDRLSFEVGQTALANLNAWEILKRTPNITVRNTTLQVRNSPNVLVTLNDKKWMMTADELRILLENTSGNDIEAIEVITNPPAQYEASGAAVVNIKLKQSRLSGYKGSLYGKYEQSIYPKGVIGISNFYNTGKWRLAASYYLGSGTYIRKGKDVVIYEEDASTWTTTLNRKDKSPQQHTYNASLGYDIDSLSSLTIGFNGFSQPRSYGHYTVPTEIYRDGKVISDFVTLNDHYDNTNKWNSYAQFQKKVNTHTFSSALQYSQNKTHKVENVLTHTYFENQPPASPHFENTNDATIRVLSAQIDHNWQKHKWALDSGLKFSDINSHFNLLFKEGENGTLQFNPLKSNTFTYKETNFAAYTTLGYQSDKWAFKGGLRAENTQLEGLVDQPADSNKQHYLQWFPTLYVQYTSESHHQLGISYGKRISRPFYTWLNPAKSYYSLFSYFQGDPRLRATITHNIETTYSYKTFITTLYYRNEKYPSMEISFQNPEDKTVMYRYTNIKSAEGAGLQLYYAHDFTEWFSANASGNTEYTTNFFWGLDNRLYENKRWTFNGRVNAQFTLQKATDWTMELSYFYTAPSIQGTFTISSFSSTSLIMSRKFLDKKLEASLLLDDIFYTEKMKVATRYANQNNYFLDARETQKITLGLRYHFGNQNVKPTKKISRTEEQDRM